LVGSVKQLSGNRIPRVVTPERPLSSLLHDPALRWLPSGAYPAEDRRQAGAEWGARGRLVGVRTSRPRPPVPQAL